MSQRQLDLPNAFRKLIDGQKAQQRRLFGRSSSVSDGFALWIFAVYVVGLEHVWIPTAFAAYL